MQRFFIIVITLIGLIYSHNTENNVRCSPVSADLLDLKMFEESAEEFAEQFTPGAFDIDLILGSDFEFLENSFPGEIPKIPSLTPNHTVNTSLFMPDHINQATLIQKPEKLYPLTDDYSLILTSIIYHPPQV